MSGLGGLENIEPYGGISRLNDDSKVSRLGPSKEDYEVLTLALKVLLSDDTTCKAADHAAARDLLKVLSYPTLIVSAKDKDTAST